MGGFYLFASWSDKVSLTLQQSLYFFQACAEGVGIHDSQKLWSYALKPVCELIQLSECLKNKN